MDQITKHLYQGIDIAGGRILVEYNTDTDEYKLPCYETDQSDQYELEREFISYIQSETGYSVYIDSECFTIQKTINNEKTIIHFYGMRNIQIQDENGSLTLNKKYSWINLRNLINIIERKSSLTQTNEITYEALQKWLEFLSQDLPTRKKNR